MGIQRLSELLAIASGTRCSGPFACVYCGAPADRPHEIPPTFTAWDTLACPDSRHLCAGCEIAREEAGEAIYPDGTRQFWSKCFRRGHSHVITRRRILVATCRHLDFLAEICLKPPDPPFAISLVTSGQKQLLYRGRVCHSRQRVLLTLEGEPIHYRPAELAERLQWCQALARVVGKRALLEPEQLGWYLRVAQVLPDGIELAERWREHWPEPLSRLAWWLCPTRKETSPCPATSPR